MSIESIVAEIDSEIAKLEQVKQLLSDRSVSKRGPGSPRLTAVTSVAPAKQKKGTLSAAARARISAAQKARWAKAKTAKGKAVKGKPEASK